jgi:Tol biopolymer transport system component
VGLGFEESEAQYGKRWTFYVQWSPNGRYLAALSAIGDLPVHFIDLILIDMNSGERRTLSPGLDLEQHYVYDFGWAANNQQLITLAQTETIQGRPIQKLYLIDVQTGDSRQVMPEYVFGGGTIESWQLAWAPNGQTLAVKCPTWFEVEPTILEDRICLISVTLRP